MAEAFEHLENVKSMLGITGTYQDNTLKGYIDEVKYFMASAGVSQSIIDSKKSSGLIARGVADLWNYGSGGTALSPYFIMRCTQLALEDGDDETVPDQPVQPIIEAITNEEIDKIIKE